MKSSNPSNKGSFISDDDVERIVNFVKEQAEADYDDAFDPGDVSESDFDGGMGGSDEGDPLFEEAKALVIETQKASASMIQRRLSVGFNRATRLMEELEAAGVIGPAERDQAYESIATIVRGKRALAPLPFLFIENRK